MRQLLLDTNALIALADPSHVLFEYTESALRAGARAFTCAVAWHEFVRGPILDKDRDRALRIIEWRILPLDRSHAEKAAALFNTTGRRRGSTSDCMIAAVAIVIESDLLTWNMADFEPFVPCGLKLCRISPHISPAC